MAIAASDLIAKGCANTGIETDSVTAGGAISLTKEFTLVNDVVSPPISGTPTMIVTSDVSEDAIGGTVRVWNAAGVRETATYTFVTSTTAAVTPASASAYRIISFIGTNSGGAGTWELNKNGAPGTLYATINNDVSLLGLDAYSEEAHRMFVFAASTAAGITRYDKLFWRNKHATLTAINPVFRLTADPQTRIRQGVHTSVGDSATIANRVTAPGGVSFVDDNVDQSGPGNIASASHQGVWIEFASTADDPNAPFESTFTTQITVQSI